MNVELQNDDKLDTTNLKEIMTPLNFERDTTTSAHRRAHNNFNQMSHGEGEEGVLPLSLPPWLYPWGESSGKITANTYLKFSK